MAHAPFIDGHQSDLEAAVATADEAGDAADGVATQTSPPSKAGLETSVALLDLRNQLPSSLTGFLTITTSTTTTTTATGSSSRNSCSTTPGSCSSSAVNSILRPITDDLSYYPTTSSPTDDPIPHPHTDYTRHFMTPNQDDELMDKIIARRSTVKRPMDEEAIAGTAVGVILAVALLAFCLYPVIVHRLNKKRKYVERYPPEAEDGLDSDGPTHGSIRHRRLSSSDSIKQKGIPECVPRQRTDDETNFWPGMDRGCGGVHDGVACTGAEMHARRAPAPERYDGNQTLSIEPASPTGFEYYTGPLPLPPEAAAHIPAHEFILKGTSEDYYSPDIPSEAFGMYATPPPMPELPPPDRTAAQTNSIRHNVRQLFRRKSSRDQGTGSYTPTAYGEQQSHAPHLQGATPLQRIVSNGDAVDSPIEISPTRGGSAFEAQTRSMSHGIADDVGTQQGNSTHQSFHHHNVPLRSKDGTSPPRHAAPGTVNPMDIMPALTESELWHRTDYQLFAATQEEASPTRSCSTELPHETEAPKDVSSSIPSHHSSSMGNTDPSIAKPKAKAVKVVAQEDIVMGDETSQPPSIPVSSSVPMPNPGQTTSRVSALSTQNPSAVSSTPSTHNTPSTQIDSPSPPSLESSDFRRSTSPPSGVESGAGVSSPRGGVYRCDEPGCNQVFDQPHKLKYVLTYTCYSPIRQVNAYSLADIISDITARITNVLIRHVARVLVRRHIYSGI